MEAGLPTGCYQDGWKQGRSVLERKEGRCARGKGGQDGWSQERWFICRRTRSGGTMLGGSVSVVADWPVFGSGKGGRFGGFGDLLVQRGPAAAAPAQRPRQGVQSPKSAGWAGCKRWMPWESHGPVWRPRESPGNWGCRWSLGSVGDRSVLESMERWDWIFRTWPGSCLGGPAGVERPGAVCLPHFPCTSPAFVAAQTGVHSTF